jgi:hypothetical protein
LVTFFFAVVAFAPVELNPELPAPDGGTIFQGTAASGGPKRCALRGSVSEGWNGEVAADCARTAAIIEASTDAAATTAIARCW